MQNDLKEDIANAKKWLEIMADCEFKERLKNWYINAQKELDERKGLDNENTGTKT